MTDRELKKMLKTAYQSPETGKESAFLRRYEKRSLQLLYIIKMESRYMGIRSLCAGLLLCVFLFLLAQNQDAEMVWTISALVPVGAGIPMLLLSRSERFGMDELEAASRFSLRFIRMVRMFILGIFSLMLLPVVSVILQVFSVGSAADCLALVVFPYLASTYGAMIVTRKWHSRDNVFGVLGVCLFGSLIPFAMRSAGAAGYVSNHVPVFLSVVLLAAILREGRLYVRESEDLSWNLC